MSSSLILIIILSYMTGSISGGIIVGKFRNIDIRKKGSNNAGATNALRTMGIVFALIVLFIDVYKGYFAANYIPYLLNENTNQAKILASLGAILGHVYPLYFKFKGGKGVGTALGTLFVFPELSINIVIGFVCWLATLIFTGFVGLSSIIAGISVSVAYLLNNNTLDDLALYSILMSIFFIFTHRENIYRMAKGKENQFKKVMIINLFKKNE
tara:strand:- start:138 stop:773 length:636 start_codon:yes stop_codon:yes gene_type:complete